MREYGGYLPLELTPLHSDLASLWNGVKSDNILALNSGRAAIYYALQMMKPEKVYVPHYICKTVVDVVERLGIPYKKYYIAEDLRCPSLSLKENECILVVNYFGILDSYIAEYIRQYKNIIIDNTQALFCPPVLKDGVYNVYSYRKFVGVSDGGALVASCLRPLANLQKDTSYSRINFLIKAIECGTNAAYMDYQAAIASFADEYLEMSLFTRRLLLSVNYKYVKTMRMQNYAALHTFLQQYNRLKCSELGKNTAACWYPLLLAEDISAAMIKNKVYVPRLWKELLNEHFTGTFEYECSSQLLLLPIDQRYTIADMQYIASLVKRYIVAAMKE
jgi:hypothetical protein